jgi:transcriptional regulator with XRE-family HTH domain
MSDSVGARLRQARELRRLTLQQVSETTKVRIHYLQALESDDHSAIPSAAQARGFLRIYADFLGLDLADLLPVARPVESPVPVVVPSEPGPSSTPRSNLWTSLREQLRRRTGKDASPALPIETFQKSEPAQAAVVPTEVIEQSALAPEPAPVVSPPVEEPKEPTPAPVEVSVPASAEVKTKSARRPRAAARKPASDADGSDEIKKNALS